MSATRVSILLGLLLAACGEDEGKRPVVGVPCEVASDCATAFPELRQCEIAVCGEQGVCELAAAADGSDCRDGSVCTGPDYCLQGVCTGVSVRCDDGDPCTVDSCDLKSGCQSVPSSGAACDDGNPCTSGDVCADGLCEAGEAIAGCCRFDGECADADPCTEDRCAQRVCTHEPSFAPCDDDNPCTLEDHCDGAGSCAGSPRSCDDDNPCTVDVCDPANGTCSTTPAEDGALCEDSNPCTVGDACAGGVCEGGESLCECTTDLDCATLEDDDLCNGTLECKGFRCQIDPLTVVACNPTGDTACFKQTCDPSTGQCRPLASQDGAACDDQNPCTALDACLSGLCLGTPTDCDDKNPCTFDACSPVTGCTHMPNNLPCDDGNACTGNDQCSGTTCLGETIACGDDNPCTNDSCDPALGCRNTPNTNACEDGDSCTVNDVCSGGVCRSGASTCQCQSDADCAPREDGNRCNGTLKCVANACVVDAATVVSCNTSGDTACSKTRCQPATGQCLATAEPNGTTCNDQSQCTTQDACVGGVCSGVAVACNDNNPCTTDTCLPATGCTFAPNTASCDDANRCTGNDQCSNGTCVGASIGCDDGNPCTIDTCNPATGCGSAPAADNTACSDRNACTTGDRCVAGACVGTAATCNDGNPCTVDSCDPALGCTKVNAADNTACNDGSACTGGDKCTAGVCGGVAITCNDNNPCTRDACNPASGCTVTNETNGTTCSDGDPCTSPDTCQTGACRPGGFVCGCQTTADCADEEDGDRCNGTLFCDTDGQCKVNPATIVSCADPGTCQDAVCQPATGLCQTVTANQGGACDDGNGCTLNDACSNGACVGLARTCDDNNPCTVDACVNGQCRYTPAFDGQACASDNNSCTNDVCQAGVCAHPALPNGAACADDGNRCTDDFCQAGSCAHPALADGLPCTDDGIQCTYDQCKAGVCEHISNDPAPVSAGQCFPVAELSANAGTVTGDWGDCGVADQFVYRKQGPRTYTTGAINSWPCADPTFFYNGDNTGYEYAYVFVAPLDGTCTFIEYNEGIPQPGGGLFGVIDWFVVAGDGTCDASGCLEYVWENKASDPVCGGGTNVCSYREFAVTEGEVFYLVADIFDGVNGGGGHQGYNFPAGWTIEMKCESGRVLLINEDFTDAVCNGCTDTTTAGGQCKDFDWHAIGGFSPSATVSIVTGYYLGQLQNNTLLGYDCGATSSTLSFPSVTVPANATACSLAFDLYLDLDPADANDCVNDVLAVKVDPAGAAPAVNVPGAACTANTTSSNPIGYETGAAVKRMTYDLTTFRGQTLQVQLGWSADAAANVGVGAIIDNVELACDVP